MMKVKYNGHQYNVYGDFHVHTVYSMHVTASPEEMVKKAKELGLEYIALTDHLYDYTDPYLLENQDLRPHLFHGYLTDEHITVIGGREMNLFSENPGKEKPGLNLTGWHHFCGPRSFDPEDALGSHDALRRFTHVLCHPERTAIRFSKDRAIKFMYDICEHMLYGCAAKSCHGYVEINTTTEMYYDTYVHTSAADLQTNLIHLLQDDMFKDIRITLGSDAHCTKDVSMNFGKYLYILEQADLLDRVVNVDRDKCDDLLADTRL